MTTAKEPARIAGLDAVRAIAITGVVVCHGSALLPGWRETGSGPVFWLGGFGVDLFFALSGWLIGGQLYDRVAAGDFSLREFWRRRWLRTLPLYLAFLALDAATRAYYLPGAVRPDWRYLCWLQSFAWPHPQPMGEAWSLAVEEWFYLLAPLLLLASWRWLRDGRRAFGLMVAGLIASSLVARMVGVVIYDVPFDRVVRQVVILRLDAIGFGMGVLWLDRGGYFARPAVRRWVLAAGAAAFVATLCWMVQLGRAKSWDEGLAPRLLIESLLPAAVALMLPSFARWRTWRWALPGRLVGGVATISYSMYLGNLPIFYRVSNAMKAGGWPIWLGLVVFGGATLALAAVTYRWIERPFIQMYRRPLPVRAGAAA